MKTQVETRTPFGFALGVIHGGQVDEVIHRALLVGLQKLGHDGPVLQRDGDLLVSAEVGLAEDLVFELRLESLHHGFAHDWPFPGMVRLARS